MGEKTVIIDYGMGNLHSVAQAVRYVSPHTDIVVTQNSRHIKDAHRIIFPGQGAMTDCMAKITQLGLKDILIQEMLKKPFLGICIGLQALFDHSEEGDISGLGIFKGNVRKFNFSQNLQTSLSHRLKIPHIGWNKVYQTQLHHPLWEGIPQNSYFYFVHSYYVIPQDPSSIIATTDYSETFVSAVAQDNIFAVQFHPEKSHIHGLNLLKNFLNWNGTC